jgi:predicted small secreted protein
MIQRLVVLLAAAVVLVGCNTFRGFGQDVERAGDRIQDKAERAK